MISIGSKRSHPLKNINRLRKIVSVLGAYGFQGVAEKIKLSRFVIRRFAKQDLSEYSSPQRLRMAFEELGPTFVKFGQLIATRPDLVPEEYCEEFKRLHDQVKPVSFSEIEGVINHHFGTDWKQIFSEFDERPLAAASIAQVYKATLKDGSKVVVKVQRPGIDRVIEEDLNVMYTLAELVERYVPEAEMFNPVGIVDEFFKTLALETNFIVEANNIRRFAKNFADEPSIKIPQVYDEFTGKRVLVMEALEGIPLSHKNALDQEGIDPEKVLRTGLRCYLKMVFTHGLFHGDLHAGNMFVMPDSRVGLIDFGVVGRLNRKTQTSIANMLIALATEDYDRFAYEYVDLAPYSEQVDSDMFARELRDLIAPYYGLTLKNLNVGKLLMDSTAIAARHRLILPSELVMYFKSIVTIEGMGRIISRDFDFLHYSLEFAAELVKSRYDKDKVVKDMAVVGRDMTSLLSVLPRHIKQAMRRLNSPGHSWRMNVPQVDDFKKSVESSSNLLFLGLVIGSLVLGSSLIYVSNKEAVILDMPLLSFIGFSIAAVLGLAAFVNYIKK